MNEKTLPHNIDAEKSVLGSMFLSKYAQQKAIESLSKELFYLEAHGIIFETIKNLREKLISIDMTTVTEELENKKQLKQIGGIEYLTEIVNFVPTAANIDEYVRIVEEKAILRRLIEEATQIVSSGYNQEEDINDVLDKAEKKILNVVKTKKGSEFRSIQDVLLKTQSDLETLSKKKSEITGIPTGFADLDRKTAGLHGSELILVAARPAMGKTAFALNIATNAAVRAGVPVAIFSLEMSKEQLVNRVLCSEAMIDSNKLKTGKIEENDWVKIVDALGPLSETELYIDDTAGISITEIRAKARKLKLEKNIGLIVIDYLQLIQGSGSRKNGSREQEISEISRSLKILAKELDVPVIALSQLSRASEQRSDHRPMLSDLRESGSIEQDADIVMFLYRDDYYNEESESKNIAEIIIAKNRSGSTGTAELLWMSNYTKFANIERYRGDEY